MQVFFLQSDTVGPMLILIFGRINIHANSLYLLKVHTYCHQNELKVSKVLCFIELVYSLVKSEVTGRF